MAENEIEVVVKATDRGASAGLKSISSKARHASDEIDKGGKRGEAGFKGLSSAVGIFGGALLGATAAVGGLFGAIQTGMDRADLDAKFQAQMAGFGPEAATAGAAAGEIYTDAFGESMADVNDTVRRVWQDIGQGSAAWTRKVSEQVISVADTFDSEMSGVTRGVGQMLRTGLAGSAEEALDIVTAAFQHGVDKSGDFLETLEEYGTQFRKLGLDGQTAVGLLTQGLQAGARDADTVADAIKEFSIRAIDGSKASSGAFKALGLDAKDMAHQIASGGDSAKQGLDKVLDLLRAVKDPVERDALAVALFGTKAEDLGKALYALDPSKAAAALGEVGGAAEKLTAKVGDTPAAKLEHYKRMLSSGFSSAMADAVVWIADRLSDLEPILKELGDEAMPILREAADSLGESFKKMDEAGVTDNLKEIAKVAGGALAAAFIGSVEAVATLADWFGKLVDASIWMRDRFSDIGDTLEKVKEWFKALPDETKDAISDLPSKVGEVITDMSDKVMYAIGWMIGTAVREFLSLPGRARNAVAALPGEISGVLSAARAAAMSVASSAVSRVVNIFTSLPGRARGAVSGLPGAIKAAAAGAGGWLVNAGWDVVRGLVHGVTSAISWGRGRVSSALHGIVAGLHIPGFAHGGVVGAAAGGGPRSNLTMVGEHGPELVSLPPGSQVRSNADSRRIASSAGGGVGQVAVTLEWVGGAAGDEFVAWLRKNIKIRGGVTAALGA